MFNLIITIIAISLVVALSGASLFYGGNAFSEGKNRADAEKIVNQIQQIKAAVTLYKLDEGKIPSKVGDLYSDYLRSIPNPTSGESVWKIDASSNLIYTNLLIQEDGKNGITLETCNYINELNSPSISCTAANEFKTMPALNSVGANPRFITIYTHL